MAYGKRDGFSYIDGMPVKISEAVRAPRKVVLPIHFHPSIPSELLTEEYDFTLERQVLADAEQRRQAREKLQKAKVEKVASDIETFSQINALKESHALESESVIQRGRDEECQINVNSETNGALQQSWKTTDILTPQPLASKSSTNSNPVLQPKSLNLADFENETSPFDYMELQTINDLEELSTVFQGIAIHTHDGRRVPRSQAPFSTSPQELSANHNDSQHQLERFSAVVDVKNAKVNFSSPAYPTTFDKAEFANGPKEDLSYLSNGYSFQPKVLYHLGRSTETNELDGGSKRDFQKMRSAKSFSDIQTAVEDSASRHGIRSRTPPPAPHVSLSTSVTRKSNGLFDHQHYYSTCNPSTSDSSLQENQRDPFLELNLEQQAFASSLADMGFSRGRVVRAVNHLGMDDKKVIDYLCLVQSLEDGGYDGEESEMAMQLHNYNTNEAKSFLDLLRQFQDLGFDKQLARDALVLHKNDRDKALDSLLT